MTAEQIMFDLKSSVALLLLLPLLWCALLWGNLPQGEIRNVQCEWMVSKKRVQDGFDSELFTSHAAKNKTLSLHPVTNHMYKFESSNYGLLKHAISALVFYFSCKIA